ncbi:hypothetical protein [Miltoncostaea oceani]|uniref:hypothetical protein n=1 Tax=Miltoncostaea oceani TaxID=2843216 RepID=UPI001C3DBE1A|nr:hypothetical protein [Miltoncostaea oceani]
MEIRRQQAIHFWVPGSGWQVEESPEATLRVRSRLSAHVSAVVENHVDQRTPGETGWRPAGRQELQGASGGLVWSGWAGAIEGRRLVFLRGVRALEELEATTFLDGLTVCDHEGKTLEEPILAGVRFSLSIEDAKIFAGRARAAGGRVQQIAPALPDVDAALSQLEESRAELEEAARFAEQTMAASSRGITLDLHRLAERAEAVWAAHRRAQRATTSLAAVADAAGERGRALGERVVAEQGRAQAGELMRRCEEYFSLYRGFEAQAARQLARLAGEEAVSMTAAADELETLSLLCAQLVAQGVPAVMREGELILDADGHTVRIGPGRVSVETPA